MKGHVQRCYTPNVHKQNTAVIDEPHNAAAFQRAIIWLHLQWRISIAGDAERNLGLHNKHKNLYVHFRSQYCVPS